MHVVSEELFTANVSFILCPSATSRAQEPDLRASLHDWSRWWRQTHSFSLFIGVCGETRLDRQERRHSVR